MDAPIINITCKSHQYPMPNPQYLMHNPSISMQRITNIQFYKSSNPLTISTNIRCKIHHYQCTMSNLQLSPIYPISHQIPSIIFIFILNYLMNHNFLIFLIVNITTPKPHQNPTETLKPQTDGCNENDVKCPTQYPTSWKASIK